MAGLHLLAATDEIQTGTTKKTILQVVAPSNQKLLINGLSVHFQGSDPTDTPVLVEFLRQSSAGGDGDALTPVKERPGDDETIQSSALSDIDGSTQPTDGDEAHPRKFIPATGGYEWQAPFGREIEVPGGGRFGIAVTAYTASVGVVAAIEYTE